MVDTSLYPPSYQQKLLTLLSEKWDLDANTDGVLIHSDNFQALNLLQARYREQVKCIYIDPPYNTGNDGFIYKDNYQHSSWLTTMENRLQAAYPLLRQDGVNFISIDDNEQSRLNLLCDEVYREENLVGVLSVENNPKGRKNSSFISVSSEYCIIFAKNKELSYFIENIPKKASDMTLSEDGKYVHNSGKRVLVGENKFNSVVSKIDSEKNYSVYYRKADNSINIKVENINQVDINLISMGYIKYYSHNNGSLIENTYTKRKFEELFEAGALTFSDNKIYERNFNDTIRIKSQLTNREYEAIVHGEKKKYSMELTTTGAGTKLKEMFGITENIFNAPKNIGFLKILISLLDGDHTILDYFAGSGTTAHAVINLNREDGGNRKYILVEQGEYFDTVLKPRVQKVIYSENWKDGKPVPSEKQSDGFNGVSQIVKVLKLESYEDTLNNLELKGQADFIGGLPESVQEDYLLRYLLDVESKGSLLNSDDFTHPFDYCLNIATDSAGAYAKTNIDLVETFNYLLGLRVQGITDEREKRGYVMVEGALPNGDRCLIVWRDVEKMGYAEVAQCFNAQNINPNSDQYDVVYLNGDHDMASLWQNEDGTESRLSLRAIEPEFLRLMFAERGE